MVSIYTAQQRLLVALAVLVGLFLRAAMLGHGLWRDEASTVFDSLGGSLGSVIERVAHSELNPPGYFILMHGWLALVPTNDIFLKLPSLIASLALVPLAALLGYRLQGPWVGVVAAWIAALAPMDLYYAQEARPYMFAAFFALLAMLGCFELIEKPDARRGILLLGAGLIGIALMQYTGLLYGGVVIALWSFARVRKWMSSRIAPVAIVGLCLFLIVAALLPSMLAQLQAGIAWDEHPSLWRLPEIAVRDLLVTLPLDWLPYHEVAKLALLALIACDAIVCRRQSLPLNVPGQRYGGVLFAAVVAMAILEAPISNHGRYMVPFAPLMWIVLAAWLVNGFNAATRQRTVGLSAAALFVALLVVCDVGDILGDRTSPKSGAAALEHIPTATLLGQQETLDTEKIRIVVAPDYLAPTVAYYLRGRSLHISGFARWNHPEMFSPLGYATLWHQAALLKSTRQKLLGLKHTGVTRLLVMSMAADDSFGIPYAKSNEFVAGLRSQYPWHRRAILPGKIESLTVDEFEL